VGARSDGAVGWGSAPKDGKSRARFPVGSLTFSSDLILLCAFSSLGSTHSLTEISTEKFPWRQSVADAEPTTMSNVKAQYSIPLQSPHDLLMEIFTFTPSQWGRDNDSLQAGRSDSRILVGARFSAPVQTGPGAHPTSHTGSFTGVKRPGHSVDHPRPSSAEVKEIV
jgi:hypothetical protein